MTSMLAKLAAPALCLTLVTGCSVDAAPAMLGYAPDNGGTIVKTAAEDEPRCEIRISAQGRMLVVEGWVHVPETVSGRAAIDIRGLGRAGSTRIDQSTGFTAAPGEPALVSRSMVMSGALYDVSLSADVDGQSLTCTERVGDVT